MTDHIEIDDVGLIVSFRRIVKVPNENDRSTIWPEYGCFPLYPVSRYANLPDAIKSRGGWLLPMYQKEAMRVCLFGLRQQAIKVYAGGVNVISGKTLMHDGTSEGECTQDYAITPGKSWLDGVAISTDHVQQLVALDSGYPIEALTLGLDNAGNIQIDVTPARRTGTMTLLVDIRHLKKTIRLMVDPHMTVEEVKWAIRDLEQVPVVSNQLFFVPELLENDRTLADYKIEDETLLYLVYKLVNPSQLSLEKDHEMINYPGGRIVKDKHRMETWDSDSTLAFNIQIINSTMFRQITGHNPPPSPINEATYRALSLTFYPLVGVDDSKNLPEMGRRRSTRQIEDDYDDQEMDVVNNLNLAGPMERFVPFKEPLEI